MRLTASIVLYKSNQEEIDNLILSIQKENCIDRLYLIDNDPDLEIKYNTDYDFVVYSNHANLGYGSGHNISLNKEKDSSDFHFIINPDIEIVSGCFRSMLDRIMKDTQIGILSPKVLNKDGSIQHLCKFIPTPFDLFLRRIPDSFLPRFLITKKCNFEMQNYDYDSELHVPYLSGCFMMLRMKIINEIGFFDERYFMYPEDIDLSRRVAARYKTIYFPLASVIHGWAGESRVNLKMLYVHFYNLILYFNKWGWFFDKKRKQINLHIFKKNTKNLTS